MRHCVFRPQKRLCKDVPEQWNGFGTRDPNQERWQTVILDNETLSLLVADCWNQHATEPTLKRRPSSNALSQLQPFSWPVILSIVIQNEMHLARPQGPGCPVLAEPGDSSGALHLHEQAADTAPRQSPAHRNHVPRCPVHNADIDGLRVEGLQALVGAGGRG